jgi:hypothetical protein
MVWLKMSFQWTILSKAMRNGLGNSEFGRSLGMTDLTYNYMWDVK